MYYRIAIDTFHFSIKCDFSSVDSIIQKIKNYLFFQVVPTKSKNPYYYFGWQYPEVGFNCFFDVKFGVRNYPVCLELNGRFFRHGEFSEKFVNFILKEFKESLLVQRVDCCIDVIYENEEDFKSNAVFCDFFPVGFPKPIIREDFKYKVGSLEGHFDFVSGKPLIDLISSGRGELKLRVYDKDKDIAAKDKDFTYSQLYGLKAYRVFRIEFAVRSDSIKNLFNKYFNYIKNASDIIFYVLSACFKRYDFVGVDFNGVFSEDVSFYAKRDGCVLENQLVDCLNKIRKQTERYCILNVNAYRKKCQELEPDTLFSRYSNLRNVDFYNAYEILEKEGVL